VRKAFELIIERAKRAHPQARIEGVHVQRMVTGGQEVITGFVRDPQFGPLLMFGSGGVEVEGLKDVAFGLAPLSTEEAEGMILRTWAGRKLRGFRSIAAADFSSVVDTLLRLSELAIHMPEIMEMEINPLKVLEPGKGAVAIDIRANIAG
jgi:acetyltransferase